MLPVTTIDIGEEAKYLVIWLHGLGANGQDFVDFIPQINLPANYPIRFVFPDAPMRAVTINAGMVMPAWFDLYSFAKDGPEDEKGILAAESWVQEIIEAQLTALDLTPDKLILAGFSQGGALALFTALRYPHKLAGVLGLSTYIPLPEVLVDSLSDANRDCEVFLAHGEYDDVILPMFARKGRQWLSQHNYHVNWCQYPMGHMVCAQEAFDIKEFLLLNCPA